VAPQYAGVLGKRANCQTENGGAKVFHGSGVIIALRAA
jgi:hypothetical protein